MPPPRWRVKASSCRWPKERRTPAAHAGPNHPGVSVAVAAHSSADVEKAAMLRPVKAVAASCGT